MFRFRFTHARGTAFVNSIRMNITKRNYYRFCFRICDFLFTLFYFIVFVSIITFNLSLSLLHLLSWLILHSSVLSFILLFRFHLFFFFFSRLQWISITQFWFHGSFVIDCYLLVLKDFFPLNLDLLIFYSILDWFFIQSGWFDFLLFFII